MSEERAVHNAGQSEPELKDAVTKMPADKICPICGETIKLVARKCIHCGEFLAEDTRPVGRWFGWTGFKGKTLWDFLGLLIIPIVLAVGGFLFTIFEADRQNNIEETRLAAQREVEANRIWETSLQTYYDQMTELLLEKQLRVSAPGTEVRSIARARTLTVLKELDPERKGALLQFLYEAELIMSGPIIDLAGADLSEADLAEANLTGAELSVTRLNEANLVQADLSRTNLFGTSLRGADLHRANLKGANLSGANLSAAGLSGVNLWGTNLEGTNLSGAILARARMYRTDLQGADLRGALLIEAGLIRADLRGVNLSGAFLFRTEIDYATQIDDKWRLVWEIVNLNAARRDLHEVDLSGAKLNTAFLFEANLRGANLRGTSLNLTNLTKADLSGADLGEAGLRGAKLYKANLNGANLGGADLSKADLSAAQVTDQQLNTAKSLKGATLPNGTIHD